MKVRRRAGASELSGHEVMVLALYRLGGATDCVDTEDVAVEANKMAPGRFVWRKYEHQINLESVRVLLSDAKKQKNGCLVSGSGREGWRLTRSGVRFAVNAAEQKRLRFRPRQPSTSRETTWLRAERKRLLASDACQNAASKGVDSVNRQMAEEFFRVDDYVTGDARERKIQRILDTFGDDPDLGDLASVLAIKVRRK